MRKRFPIPGGPATIHEVAELAGVSIATVSKYFSPKDYYIAPRTREKVAAAAKQLQYVPNSAARQLVRQKSGIIGLLIPNITNPYYPDLVAAAEEVFRGTEFRIQIVSTEEDPELERAALRTFGELRVEGVLLCVVPEDDELISDLVADRVEVVYAGRNSAQTIIDSVVPSDRDGARAATAHLLDHEPEALVHLAGPPQLMPFALRAEGFHAEVESRAFTSHSVITAPSASRADALETCRNNSDSLRPGTAVFAGNDLMALGVLDHCAEAGLQVGVDILLAGFDNISVSGIPGVDITSANGRIRDIGHAAAARLLERVRNSRDGSADDAPAAPEQVALESPVVVRKSCGCP